MSSDNAPGKVWLRDSGMFDDQWDAEMTDSGDPSGVEYRRDRAPAIPEETMERARRLLRNHPSYAGWINPAPHEKEKIEAVMMLRDILQHLEGG